MASNFAFKPAGLSQTITVGAAAPVTVSLSVTGVGSGTPPAMTGGAYVPQSMRIVNPGTAAAFVQFGPSAGSISVSATNGMMLLNGTDRVFGTGGLPYFAAICASTFTVTLNYTLGEGL